jgi:predicted transposase YdaD
MKDRFDFDGALKDLFQQDRPTLLDHVTGGLAIREFLNVELPKVQQRRVDLVLLLADGSILHLEFQSTNQPDMPYRMAIYHVLLADRYRRPLRHVVLYVGQAKMRMTGRLDTGLMQFTYNLKDIREIQAETLLETGKPADYALAILAGGGPERLSEIVERIADLEGPRRDRALAQLVILCGLRPLSSRLELELARMGLVIDISKNVILQRLRKEAIEEGKQEGWQVGRQAGRQEGRQEAMQTVLRDQLKTKFGRLPKWASQRLTDAPIAQMEKWAKKIVLAKTPEDVFGTQ